MTDLSEVDTGPLVKNRYKPQPSGTAANATTSIPPSVLEAAADEHGVSRETLIDEYEVVHAYDGSGRDMIEFVEPDE